MKIGITERGDAARDLSWRNKLDTIDGAILITKVLTDEFLNAVKQETQNGHRLIVHATCTGFGGTALEPHVMSYEETMAQFSRLCIILPPDRIVLRVDPLFPTAKGMDLFKKVMIRWKHIWTTRVRISIVDEYKHVRERYAAHGWEPIYNGNFGPSIEQIKLVSNTVSDIADSLDWMPLHKFETCAEPLLAQDRPDLFTEVGCVSRYDLDALGLEYEEQSFNPHGRNGCCCLECKTELLDNRRQCPNGCVYCYWKGACK